MQIRLLRIKSPCRHSGVPLRSVTRFWYFLIVAQTITSAQAGELERSDKCILSFGGIAHTTAGEWHAHSGVFTAVIVAILVQAAMIAALLVLHHRSRKAEGRLRISEERYREVVECQTEMVCRFREDTTLTFVNEAYCRFFEKQPMELLGKPFLPLIPKEQHAAVQEMLRRIRIERRTDYHEHQVLLHDGSTRWMEWQNFAIFDARGQLEEFQGIGRDVTERRQATDALVESDRKLAHSARLALVGELAASIAHEINQPLGAILSNAEAAELLLNLPDPPLDELRVILSDIRKDDLRASEVIQRVRALVSKRPVERRTLKLNEVISDTLRLVERDAQRRGVTLHCDLAHCEPEVRGDAVQLQQALLNLLINGMDAMNETPPGNRRLEVRSANGHPTMVEVSVADSGHGVAPDALPRIFESFFTTKEHGMGLGLAMVQSIVEFHCGKLSAENNPGGGVTFRLRLPLNNSEHMDPNHG